MHETRQINRLDNKKFQVEMLKYISDSNSLLPEHFYIFLFQTVTCGLLQLRNLQVPLVVEDIFNSFSVFTCLARIAIKTNNK
jgi:hypothetical protein